MTLTEKKNILQKELQKGFVPAYVRQYNELLYRIEVLENLQMLAVTAPVSKDNQALLAHFTFVQETLNRILNERLAPNPSAESVTGLENLMKLVTSHLDSFKKFNPEPYPEDTYRKAIMNIYKTVSNAFILYRNTICKV